MDNDAQEKLNQISEMVGDVVREALTSNSDTNDGRYVNVVDALGEIAKALHRIADALFGRESN
jgi:hypothetical protein